MTLSNCENECLHYEVCKALHNLPNAITAFGSCKFYTNKSEYIKLPYKIGNATVDRQNGEVVIKRKRELRE